MDYRRKWLKHALKTNNTRIPKLVYAYIPTGRRQVRPPTKIWTDQRLSLTAVAVKLDPVAVR